MSQLTANSPLVYEIGDSNSLPVKASQEIFLGSAVGLTGGYARQLNTGDTFAGFAEQHVLEATAADGGIRVPVKLGGKVAVAVSAAAVTDVGKLVYASDGQTFTFTASGNVLIGRMIRWVSTGNIIVQFSAGGATAIALTDNTTGTASTTLAAGVGVITVPLFVNFADIAAADLLTTYTPGYAFKILGTAVAVEKVVTTGSKLATLTPKISGTSVTGGVLSLTSAALTPQGTVLAGSAVTALNVGTAADTISLTGSAVTAFVEGSGWILLKIQNMDTANAIASLAAIL